MHTKLSKHIFCVVPYYYYICKNKHEQFYYAIRKAEGGQGERKAWS